MLQRWRARGASSEAPSTAGSLRASEHHEAHLEEDVVSTAAAADEIVDAAAEDRAVRAALDDDPAGVLVQRRELHRRGAQYAIDLGINLETHDAQAVHNKLRVKAAMMIGSERLPDNRGHRAIGRSGK